MNDDPTSAEERKQAPALVLSKKQCETLCSRLRDHERVMRKRAFLSLIGATVVAAVALIGFLLADVIVSTPFVESMREQSTPAPPSPTPRSKTP